MDLETAAERLRADAYASGLGCRVTSVDGPTVVVELDLEERHTNFLGTPHGGLIFSVADCAFSLASNAAGPRAVAIDTHLVLSGSAEVGDTVTATAIERTRGRTLATYQVDVTRGDGRVIAMFTGTVFIVG